MNTEYKIVIGRDTESLEYNVKHALEDGWDLLGGVAVSPSGYFVQAMVKKTTSAR